MTLFCSFTWNELPLTLRLLPRNNMSSFCKLLKTFLFGRSWTESAAPLSRFLEGVLYKYPEWMNDYFVFSHLLRWLPVDSNRARISTSSCFLTLWRSRRSWPHRRVAAVLSNRLLSNNDTAMSSGNSQKLRRASIITLHWHSSITGANKSRLSYNLKVSRILITWKHIDCKGNFPLFRSKIPVSLNHWFHTVF